MQAKTTAHVQTLVGLSQTATATTFTYRKSWHVASDVRTRVHEVQVKGDDPVARHKLAGHVIMIAIAAVLTAATTYACVAWMHWDCTIPVMPSIVQECWDWIYKY